MSESPIEHTFAHELDEELSDQAQSAGRLIDYNHQPPGPPPDLSELDTGREE